MTWIDNNGEVRPQSWEEYLTMKGAEPDVCNCLICVRIRERERHSKPEPSHGIRKARQIRKARLPKPDPLPRMRIRLFRADPHCFWCGVEVQLERMTVARKDNLSTLATVDHLYSRWHPERKIRHTERSNGAVLHVLACHDCNQERAGAETQMRPFIPKLKERLGFAQQADATLATIGHRSMKATKTNLPISHPAKVRTLKEEFLEETRRVLPMRVIQTIEEAIEYAREHPAR